MRVPASVPKKGDYYPTVRAWMARLGATELDIKANEIFLDERGCRAYVAAILGPKFNLRFRRLNSSEGRGWHKGITLDRDLVEAKRMSLGTVLHECAHAIQWRKYAERAKLRRERMAETRTYRAKVARRDHCGHGEPFCRTYARLLREAMQ